MKQDFKEICSICKNAELYTLQWDECGAGETELQCSINLGCYVEKCDRFIRETDKKKLKQIDDFHKYIDERYKETDQ